MSRVHALTERPSELVTLAAEVGPAWVSVHIPTGWSGVLV